MRRINLTKQLLIICVIVIGIVLFSLGIVLPNNLIPIYETHIYNYLRQPLFMVHNEEDINGDINTEIAYIYINNVFDNNIVSVSDNLINIINIKDVDVLLDKINYNIGNGKFKYKMNTYYYVTSIDSNQIKIAICDDGYINDMKRNIFDIVFRVVGITFVIIALLIISWSNHLVNRIKRLKDRIDNLNNDRYNHKVDSSYSDELYTLDTAIESMRMYLKNQDEYKNQMYQNISHDFKTPIMVMKSYIEASDDGTTSVDKTLNVIKEQLKKLEIKVHSLLYLNKLNYFQDRCENLNEEYDVSLIINNSVDKFKLVRPDLEFVLDIDKKSVIFRGSADMWEAIIDNILNNFMRYAKKKVKITVKNNKIILYNDGENIDKSVIDNVFMPYEKGVNGVFGLGLSIVKKTLLFLNYDISIENLKRGVKFIIY